MVAQYENPNAGNLRDSTRDRTSLGGRARTYNDRGELVMGSADDATQRYQGLGESAARRAAYQANYAGYDQAMKQGQQSRAAQGDALSLQRNAAYGNAPSQAQILGRNMLDQSMDAQMSMAASARGGSLAQAAAQRQAANSMAAQQQQGVNQLSALRAQEMAQARGEYMAGASGMRGQDYGAAGLGLQKSGQELQNEQFQRGLNQQGQQHYEDMGLRAQEDQQQADMQAAQLDAANYQNQTHLDAHSQDRETGLIASLAGAGGSVVGALGDAFDFSDERTKMDVTGLADIAHGAADDATDNAKSVGHDMTAKGAETGTAPKKSGPGLGAALGGVAQKTGASIGQSYGPMDRSTLTSIEYRPIMSSFGAKMDIHPMAQSGVSNPTFDKLSAGGGGMDVMGSLKAHSDFGTQFVKSPMTSDERAKDVVPLADAGAAQLHVGDDGRAFYATPAQPAGPSLAGPTPRYSVGLGATAAAKAKEEEPKKKRKMTDAEAAELSRKADAMMAGDRANLARGASVDPMQDANRAQEGFAYRYKPGFTPSNQADGEQNVGPMAQNLASDPVASTAVKRDANGYMVLDPNKLSKLHSASIASLQKQIDEMRMGAMTQGDYELARRAGRKGY